MAGETLSPEQVDALVFNSYAEADFQSHVLEIAAALNRWWVFHDLDPRRNEAGFPDLFMIAPGRTVFAELKTMRRYPTLQQKIILTALRDNYEEVYLWRPSDLDRIEQVLTQPERPTLSTAENVRLDLELAYEPISRAEIADRNAITERHVSRIINADPLLLRLWRRSRTVTTRP